MRRLAALAGLTLALTAVLALPMRAADRLAWLDPPAGSQAASISIGRPDTTLVDSAGPIAVALLRLDPAHARVASVLARPGEVDSCDSVSRVAATRHAVAAVNGGLFNSGTNEPVGILKVGGELVSDSSLAEGVVAIHSPDRGRTTLEFDLQVTVTAALAFAAGGRHRLVSIDGIDTTRARGHVMLYTPQYHADTDTAASGIEWRLEGSPLHVVEVRARRGRT